MNLPWASDGIVTPYNKSYCNMTGFICHCCRVRDKHYGPNSIAWPMPVMKYILQQNISVMARMVGISI